LRIFQKKEKEGPALHTGSEGLGGLKSETRTMNRARQHLLHYSGMGQFHGQNTARLWLFLPDCNIQAGLQENHLENTKTDVGSVGFVLLVLLFFKESGALFKRLVAARLPGRILERGLGAYSPKSSMPWKPNICNTY
jgi:hypothetical protein